MENTKYEKEIKEIELENIMTKEVGERSFFEHDELVGLSKSIAETGVIQPIIVRKEGEIYILVAGERRLKASGMAGKKTIPARVMQGKKEEMAVVSLVENVQRKNLNCLDEARAIGHILANLGYTQEELARKLGKSQGAIANKIRLLKLPKSVQDEIKIHQLTERHGRALLKLGEQEEQEALVKEIIQKGYTVKQTEKRVEEYLKGKEKKRPKMKLVIKDVRIFINTINKAIDVMKTAGIHAHVRKEEKEDVIEYTIQIPVEKREKAQVA